ncbi:Puratrophin-1 [Operophtera brumata]|uniref:Puratrophin-1 n=1 Tax=Operophtera brumata TaxID=104452 RepID=A0A0L7LDL9_OPEBR|nr:Puratrophin-1 [Operophtera brumata]
MTQEVDFTLHDDEHPLSSEEASDDEDVVIRKDRASVREMIMRFERTTINSSFRDSSESLAKSKDPLLGSLTSVVNPIQAHNQHLYPVNRSHDRNSNVSVNSILSNASENSCESSSSGFISDRKSGIDILVPHRPAPPPPTPIIDDNTSEEITFPSAETSNFVERRFSFTTPNTSPVLARRSRQPPVMRRKSTAESLGHQHQKGDTHWSYGVKQSDLEKLLRLKSSETSDNEDDTLVASAEPSEKGSSGDDSDSSDGSSSNGREYALSADDGRTDTVSTDHSTDTLINEDGEENNDGDDDMSVASGESGARSNYDNVSIKSISSFDMIPYQKYDSITVSSDEFGSEVCHAPDTEFLTVSAVNEWCVSKSAEPVLIPVETKKEKYRRAVVLGDFNYNLLVPDNSVEDYKVTLQENGYRIMNKITPKYCTRETLTKKSLLDHISTNLKENQFSLAVIESSMSDHKQMFFEIDKYQPPLKRTIQYQSIDYGKLQMLTEEVMNNTKNSDFDVFEEKLCKTIEQCKLTKTKILNPPRQDWINAKILESIDRKNLLYKLHKRMPEDVKAKDHFMKESKMVAGEIQKMKNEYYYNKFSTCTSNPRKMWSLIDSLTHNKVKDASMPAKLVTENAVLSDGIQICHHFNYFFSTIGSKLAQAIPIEYHDDKNYTTAIVDTNKTDFGLATLNLTTTDENVYVERLRHVVEDYIPQMTKSDLPPSFRALKPDIFSNIERIFKFHSEEFLPALRDCENDLRKLGQCFRRFEKRFNMYVMYSRNNKRATRLVFEHKPFFQEIQLELGDRLDLSSYLLEPVQRIPRYKLFLVDLVKTYTNYENEKCETDSRLSVDSDETGGSNGESSDNDETPLESLKLGKTMIECVLTAHYLNLLSQGRLLKQNEFYAMDTARRRRQLMRIFLFDKLQPRVECFIYKDHIPVDDLGITAKELDAHKFTIWYKKRNLKSYKLETADSVIRNAWVEEITSLLWEQAMQKKDNSLRGVPGEVRRPSEKKFRRTTWYCE